MRGPNVVQTPRRSSRVPATVPVLVTTLKPGTHFSEICQTLVVSAHGCAIHSPLKVDAGVPVHLHTEEGRQTTAQVVSCQPMANREGWMVAASLERPENFWGLKSCPEDWMRLPQLPAPRTPKLPPAALKAGNEFGEQARALKAQIAQLEERVSEATLKATIADLIKPLHAEIAELKEKLSNGKRSKFEVSLSQIPPELEEQLWTRLRKDVGAQVVRQALEQSEHVLDASKAAIDQRMTQADATFQENLTKELRAVEERMHGILTDSSARVRHHVGAALEKFQQQTTEAGALLQHRSEELFSVLKQRLGEEHEAHRWDMQQLQTALAAESSRLQEQIEDLTIRMAKLDDAARHLEADFSRRLAQMATEIASNTHDQLEKATDALLQQAQARNGKELSDQLDQACANLKIIQKGIEASISESLKTHAVVAVKTFEQTIDDVAQHSAAQWRQRLASGLNSVIQSLGEQFRFEAGSEEG